MPKNEGKYTVNPRWHTNEEKYNEAYAEWMQLGFEISQLEKSETPENYKRMMRDHLSKEPFLTKGS